MRAEVQVAGAPPVPALEPARSPGREVRAGVQRLDRFELGALVVFAALSLWVLGLDLFQVIAHGRIWTGTDGFYLVDQMQYLAWIREAAHHVLVSNMFVLRGTPADYFQPAIALSGGLAALGVAPWLALLVWKPVAVLAWFWGVNEFTRRTVIGTWPRRIALVLSLFFGSFTIVYGSFGIVGDLFAPFLSWGYTFGLLALGAMVLAILAYDRCRSAHGFPWAPAALGALASSVHPWQGELLILIVVGSETAAWRLGRASRRGRTVAAATLMATAIPLVYYAALGRLDPTWEMARVGSKHSFSIWTILLAVAPLLLPAALAYRRRPRTFLETVTRVWPLGALLIFVLSATDLSATPLHAFEGITLPLAVLAVEGLRQAGFGRLPRRGLVAALALAAVTIPATYYELHSARGLVAPSQGNANFVSSGERQALSFLARTRTPGGVLTRFYLGAIVPAETGRRTWVGDCLWSRPECSWRAQVAQRLLNAELPPAMAREVINQIGARFVLADCLTPPGLERVLAPMTATIHRFGCATVYVLSSPGPATGPLS